MHECERGVVVNTATIFPHMHLILTDLMEKKATKILQGGVSFFVPFLHATKGSIPVNLYLHSFYEYVCPYKRYSTKPFDVISKRRKSACYHLYPCLGGCVILCIGVLWVPHHRG